MSFPFPKKPAIKPDEKVRSLMVYETVALVFLDAANALLFPDGTRVPVSIQN